MADEKTISFKIEINGLSNEAQELQKLQIWFQNLNKEYKDLQKSIKQSGGFASNEQLHQLAALSKAMEENKNQTAYLKKVIDTAGDSLDRMKASLIKMKQEADAGSEELRNKMAPAITELTQKISTAEQAQGTWSRNVGNYANSMGQSFVDFGKRAIAAISPIALIITAFTATVKGLKDALESTTAGMNFFNQMAAQWKQLMYDILTTGNLNVDNLNAVATATDKLNKLRVIEMYNTGKISELNREEQLTREQAVDQTKSHSERLALYLKVKDLEHQKTLITIDDLGKELKAQEIIAAARPKDEKQKIIVIDLQNKINDAIAGEAEAMRRVDTQISGFENDEIKSRQAVIDWWVKAAEDDAKDRIEAAKKENAEIRKLDADNIKWSQDQWKKMVDHEKKTDDFKINLQKLFGIKSETLGLQQNKEKADKEKAISEKVDKDDVKAANDKAKTIKAIEGTAIDETKKGLDDLFTAKVSRLNAEMAAELSNTNLTEAQKSTIKKKYAKEEQSLEIKKAIIDEALSIVKTFAEYGFTPAGWIAAAVGVVEAGLEIAAIKAQTFALGGKIKGGYQVHSDTSRDNTLILVKQNEAILNERQIAALGGSGAMRYAGVPGFASGGYVGQQSPYIPPSANSSLINEVSNLKDQFRLLEVRLDINKLNDAQKELQVITQTQKI
jgi:hypothetical protein